MLGFLRPTINFFGQLRDTHINVGPRPLLIFLPNSPYVERQEGQNLIAKAEGYLGEDQGSPADSQPLHNQQPITLELRY